MYSVRHTWSTSLQYNILDFNRPFPTSLIPRWTSSFDPIIHNGTKAALAENQKFIPRSRSITAGVIELRKPFERGAVRRRSYRAARRKKQGHHHPHHEPAAPAAAAAASAKRRHGVPISWMEVVVVAGAFRSLEFLLLLGLARLGDRRRLAARWPLAVHVFMPTLAGGLCCVCF